MKKKNKPINERRIRWQLHRWAKFAEKYNKKISPECKDILRADIYAVEMAKYDSIYLKTGNKMHELDKEYKMDEYDMLFDKLANQWQKDEAKLTKQYNAKKYEKAKSDLESWFYKTEDKFPSEFDPEYKKKLRKLIHKYKMEEYEAAQKKRHQQFIKDQRKLGRDYRIFEHQDLFRQLDREFYYGIKPVLIEKHNSYPKPSKELHDKWFKLTRVLEDPEYEIFCDKILEMYSSTFEMINAEWERKNKEELR